MSGPGITASEMRNYIAQAIAGVPAAAPRGGVVYMLYLPDGVSEADPVTGLNTDCKVRSGIHFTFDSSNAWAFTQRCGKSTADSPLNDLTTIASHEIGEAVTDFEADGYRVKPAAPDDPPWDASAWAVFDGPGHPIENGDLCSGTRITEAGFVYQRLWSNAAAAAGGDPCVPGLEKPYYNVSTDTDWYTIASGGTTSVAITGWSTGTLRDWFVEAAVKEASLPGFTVTASGPTMASGSVSLNDRKTATLIVSAPSAPKGTYAIVRVRSSQTPSAEGSFHVPADGGDRFHQWLVGVHIE
jgi:hypothetical protein